MKKFIPEEVIHHRAAALDVVQPWSRYGAYIGLDVHKETIAVAVARPGRGEPEYRSEIANARKALRKWLDRLNEAFGGALLLFCYAAGSCGYGLYRWLSEAGHDCHVVAPSLIPKKAGERVKTDRRDALKLAGVDALRAALAADRPAGVHRCGQGGDAARHGPDRGVAAGLAGLVIGAGGRCPGGVAGYRQTGRDCAAGGRRSACAAATASSVRRARTSSWCAWRSPASGWALSGTSCATRCRD